MKSGLECLRNQQTFLIIESCRVSRLTFTFVTGIVRTQSVSVCQKSSSMLMTAITGTGCELMRRDKICSPAVLDFEVEPQQDDCLSLE